MKTNVLIIIIISFFNVMAQKETPEPITVDHVDLNKYTGIWYEIAKIPNSFQKKCISNSAAHYSLNEDGSIKVVNSCKNSDGEMNSSEGVAEVVDTKTNSRLKVSFVSIFGINFFWGDYWIIGLNDDYSYAVIGTPNRKYGWILSRTKQLSEEKLSTVYDILQKNGYNTEDFVPTLQE